MPYLLLFQKASPNCGSYYRDRRVHEKSSRGRVLPEAPSSPQSPAVGQPSPAHHVK